MTFYPIELFAETQILTSERLAMMPDQCKN